MPKLFFILYHRTILWRGNVRVVYARRVKSHVTLCNLNEKIPNEDYIIIMNKRRKIDVLT